VKRIKVYYAEDSIINTSNTICERGKKRESGMGI
jgi:hypothetical protein